MIFLTGDTHGDYDIHKLAKSNFEMGHQDYISKDDYLIILGDFGLVWHPHNTKGYKNEKYWLDWLNDKPFTTLFVDGNHENHPLLYDLPIIEKFGGNVGKVKDSIFHLKRGEVYEIDNEKYFVMGGGTSIDKNNRTPGESWWKEEIPSVVEFECGLQNLEKHNWEVDYILGHTCPSKIKDIYFKDIGLIDKSLQPKFSIECPVEKYFDVVVEKTKFKIFYFGHLHDEWTHEKYVMLYKNIVLLGNDHNDKLIY